ncbi:hypothetical protein N7495_000646 [Penicillium taxi]|uniref:uncharacterized protein n=1 Tax=Penicillium taxi TaxID=168475 RepID=UPI002545BC49|nr:uncharacterized protein N7495_000646 [Penicillium taxi]KAJ5907964.1 hypothetical protein N7495_000646 [Penicillium taxi]
MAVLATLRQRSGFRYPEDGIKLRRIFGYPEDSDNDEGREELDEEEQEQVIDQLKHDIDARNTIYQFILVILSLCSIPFFVLSVFTGKDATERTYSFISVVSLLGSGLIIARGPLYPDRKGKQPMRVENRDLKWLIGPIFGTVNLVLACLHFFIARGATMIKPEFYLIPGIIFAAVQLARGIMRSVDASTLKALTYAYKGA